MTGGYACLGDIEIAFGDGVVKSPAQYPGTVPVQMTDHVTEYLTVMAIVVTARGLWEVM